MSAPSRTIRSVAAVPAGIGLVLPRHAVRAATAPAELTRVTGFGANPTDLSNRGRPVRLRRRLPRGDPRRRLLRRLLAVRADPRRRQLTLTCPAVPEENP
jgi:hypothetical protein